MNGFDLTKNANKEKIDMTRFWCKLSQEYKYSLSSGPYCYGQLRKDIYGEWNWFLRGSLKVVAKGNGSFDECVAQIKAF